MNRDRELGRAAAIVVDELRTQHTNIVALLRQQGYLDYITAAAGNGPMALPADLAMPMLWHRAHHTWAATATVYAIHPDMVAELGQADRVKVPSAILSYLPHRNPMIVYPEPLECVNLGGVRGQIIAVYVMGIHAREGQQRRICDTDSADRTGIRLVILSRSDTHIEFGSVIIDTTTTWFSPEDAVQATARRAAELDDPSKGGKGYSVDEHLAAAASKLMPVLDTMLYVCSKGMDAEQTNSKRAQRTKKKRQRRTGSTPVTVINVGWRLGPKLAAARRNAEQRTRESQSTGRKAPHPRKAHYGIRWTGPGRTVPELTFIRATYVNAGNEDEIMPTIIPVS